MSPRAPRNRLGVRALRALREASEAGQQQAQAPRAARGMAHGAAALLFVLSLALREASGGVISGPESPEARAGSGLLSDVVSYDKFRVFRVIPTTLTHVTTLSQLEDAGDVDVWTKSRELNAPWDIMVKPLMIGEVKRILNENKLQWSVLIDDVGRSFRSADKVGVTSRMASLASSGARYPRFKEVNEYLDELAQRFPQLASVQSIGKTSEGRDMRVLRVSTTPPTPAGNQTDAKASAKSAGKAKPAIWIDAGIHAREWIAPATALYIAQQLVENATHTANLTRHVDWYILPVMNPDGYEYSHTNDRLWRKTRSKTWWGLGCAGADANRNFDFHWREVGASWSSCSFTYAGSKAFSEPEARAVRDFLLANKDQIKMYLTYHSYGNFLLYPWGYTSTLPDDWKTLDSLAKKANKAMVAAGSEKYTIGSSTNVLYAAAGGSDDWAKGVAGIELSYTIELPGGDGHGFDLPPSYIPQVGYHQMKAIDVFADYVGSMSRRLDGVATV